MRDNEIILKGLVLIAVLGTMGGVLLLALGKDREGIALIVGPAGAAVGGLCTSYVGRRSPEADRDPPQADPGGSDTKIE